MLGTRSPEFGACTSPMSAGRPETGSLAAKQVQEHALGRQERVDLVPPLRQDRRVRCTLAGTGFTGGLDELSLWRLSRITSILT